MTTNDSILDRDEWTQILQSYIRKLAQVTHDFYSKLYVRNTHSIEEPVNALRLCGLLADGVVGFLSVLNMTNEEDTRNRTGPDKFDSIRLFLDLFYDRLPEYKAKEERVGECKQKKLQFP